MKKLLVQCISLTVIIFISCSCKKGKETTYPSPVPPIQPVLLKEINIPNLPSPYYRFEYKGSGNTSFASFASGFFVYDIAYSGGKINEMRNNIIVNKDRLIYSYDNAGKAISVIYADSNGIVYKRMLFTYEGQRLIKSEREVKSTAGFIIEKTMTFYYHTDGNLRELTDHRHPINGLPAYTIVDRFEQYDNKINVDGFSLLHNEFFDHLVLLPGVQLQKNNPGKLTRTGDGLNYKIDYSYTYNDKNLPLTKKGNAIITNGPGTGQLFETNSLFSYY